MLDLIEPLRVTKNRRGDLLHGEGILENWTNPGPDCPTPDKSRSGQKAGTTTIELTYRTDCDLSKFLFE